MPVIISTVVLSILMSGCGIDCDVLVLLAVSEKTVMWFLSCCMCSFYLCEVDNDYQR